MKEIFLDCCGYVCTALTLVSYVPQLIKIIRTKHADDLSVSSWILWILGATIWEVYSLIDGSIGLIVAQSVELSMLISTLVLTLLYRNSRSKEK